MTPENDVSPEPEHDSETSAAETETDNAANSEPDTEAAGDAARNDLERAAEAQEADGLDTGEDPQDPLGFGDQRMPEAEASEEDPLQLLTDQLAAAEAKAADNWEQLLRLQAEMENQRKRGQKDVGNARKFALEGFANELLPVRDSLEMGIQAATEAESDSDKIVEGSVLTLKMLSQVFEKFNIVEINPIDEKFDPEFHQAMSTQPAEGKEPNTVVNVLQKGYTLNERLIRPALVMVAK